MLDSLLNLLEENPKEMNKEKMEHLLHVFSNPLLFTIVKVNKIEVY
jgi:hypothetical protein